MECTKSQYTTERFALADIARIKKISSRDKVPVRAYFCDKCNFWHLTSEKNKKDQKNNDKIIALESEVKSLTTELEALKKANNKEDRALVKADSRVKLLNERVKILNELTNKLRADNKDLINKNIQLQNKLDEIRTSNDNRS